jgi:RHS repeat-associated protein
MVRQVVTPAMTHYVAYDGNGKVTGLVNASTGDYSALYEYDPFGQTIRITGTMAKNNPFRFSTKYRDEATDMVYYGYRYYNPGTGRWLNRDPIEEIQFRETLKRNLNPRRKAAFDQRLPLANEMTFVENRPNNVFDLLGLTTWRGECIIVLAGELIGGVVINCSLVRARFVTNTITTTPIHPVRYGRNQPGVTI